MKFSLWLKYLIQAKGWSQTEAARHLGFSQPQISGWLSGRTTPTLVSLEQIADRLNRNPEDVLGEVYGRSWDGGSVIPLDRAIARIEAEDPDDRIVICSEILERAVKDKRKPDLDEKSG